MSFKNKYIDLDIVYMLGGIIIGDWSDIIITNVQYNHQFISTNSLFIGLIGSKMDGSDFALLAEEKGAVAVIISKPIQNLKIPSIIVDNVFHFLSNYAAKIRKKITKPIIAILGSFGKTTIKHYLKHILPGKVFATRRSFNIKWSIGIEFLLLNNNYDYIIVEVGTNCPGEIDLTGRFLTPDYVIYTGTCLEHTEFLNDLNGIIEEEKSILQYTRKAAILDDTIPEHDGLKCYTPKDYENLPGSDHEKKILLLCGILEINIKDIKQRFLDVSPPCFRGNKIVTSKHIIYDHSFNANPGSVEYVINNLNEKCDFIFAEMEELGIFSIIEHERIAKIMNKNTFIKRVFYKSNINLSIYGEKFIEWNDQLLDQVSQVVCIQGSKCHNLVRLVCSLIDNKIIHNLKHQ